LWVTRNLTAGLRDFDSGTLRNSRRAPWRALLTIPCVENGTAAAVCWHFRRAGLQQDQQDCMTREKKMKSASLEEGRIKDLFETALLEVLQDRKGLLYDILAEVIDDNALAEAIKEGGETEPGTREEVLKTLRGASCKSSSGEDSSGI
jgi:hypothetical protein